MEEKVKKPESDLDIFLWYKRLLEVMEYGDSHELIEKTVRIGFGGEYHRTRTTLYTAFLLKYGVGHIVVRRCNDEIGECSLWTYDVELSINDVRFIKEKILGRDSVLMA